MKYKNTFVLTFLSALTGLLLFGGALVSAASLEFYNTQFSGQSAPIGGNSCSQSDGNYKLSPPMVVGSSNGSVTYNCVEVVDAGGALDLPSIAGNKTTGCATTYGGLDLGSFGYYCLPPYNTATAPNPPYKTNPVKSSTAFPAAEQKSADCVASGGSWELGSANSHHCVCTQAGTKVDADKCVLLAGDGGESDPAGTPTGGDLQLDGDGNKILSLLQDGIDLLTAVAGLAITAMVIVGGIQYSTAGGNPQAAAGAKKKITNAFLALVTLVFIFTFLQWLVPGGIFG